MSGGTDKPNLTWRKSPFSDDENCVEVAISGEGGVWVRDSKDPHGPRLRFTGGEWQAFVAGIRGGHFDTRD
jgi:hypothetical protein